MVWKDVTVGFTVAGVGAAFVPGSFFETLFINTGGGETSFDFLTLLQHVVIAPLAAFLTFIASMGNIPLVAILYGNGVSFAGVMAFIFSDLVVFPVLRINAKYYGWKMALFIVFLLFTALVVTALLLHYGFELFNLIPSADGVAITERQHFAIDYTFYLNLAFLVLSGLLIYLGFFRGRDVKHEGEMAPKSKVLEKILTVLAFCSFAWLAVGIVLKIS